MNTAKINNISVIATVISPMYAPVQYNSSQYKNAKYPLLLTARVSSNNMWLIHHENPKFLMVMAYVQSQMVAKLKCHALEAIIFEFKADWHNGFMSRNAATPALKQMCDLQILRKVNTSQKCQQYYVNPHVFHVLSAKQRIEYHNNHSELFEQIRL